MPIGQKRTLMTRKQVDMAVYDWRPWVPDAGYFIYWNWLPDSFTNYWNYVNPEAQTLGNEAITMAIGIPVGVWGAASQDSVVDYGGKAYGILGVAMPLFWGGLVLLHIFYFKLGIAPAPTGRIDMLVSPPRRITGSYLLDGVLTGDLEAFMSSAARLVLPVITLAFVTGASIARMTYTSMRKVLASQFILVSHAYGISSRAIVYKFALKNALMPVVTLIGLQVGFLIGGVVFVEVVFSLPGIGRYAVESLLVNDFAPVQGFVLLVLVVYLLVNLLVDLLYSVLNPQVRNG
jgi:peptide/nickel transport system permease protein